MSPRLSVLIPFYHDDPSDLLQSLLAQVDSGADAEILLYDDGTNDPALDARLVEIAAPHKAATLMLGNQNQGRSAARNALFEAANSDWVLFLDADMMPASGSFLSDYITIIEAGLAEIIFGGFKMSKTKPQRDFALHHAFSKTSDCLPAEARNAAGAKYVCSSNLAVRADILKENGFDTGFVGWGWEDSEWAARVSKAHTLLHIENPAYHLGLESTQTLLSRFKNSAANYERFTDRHPALAKTLTLYSLVQRLKHVPGQSLLRPVLGAIVRNPAGIMPMRLRLLALKLWRASWYAAYASTKRTPLNEAAA